MCPVATKDRPDGAEAGRVNGRVANPLTRHGPAAAVADRDSKNPYEGCRTLPTMEWFVLAR